MAWINDDMVLYHGCSDQSLYPINQSGIVVSGGPHNISLQAGAFRPDFGRGFYTTTWLHQAREWANLRVLKVRRRHTSSTKAVVLRMQLRRNRFAMLESLVFPSDRDNYYSFVAYCRGGGILHAALAHRDKPYDVVVGPVSIGRQQLVIGQADQVSFHTPDGLRAIAKVTVHETGNPLF